MLQQPNRLLVDKLCNHITQYRAHSVEPLVSLADVLQAHVVEQDLLDDEDSNSLAELGTGLHDAEAEWNNFGGEEEVDDFGAVVLDQCSNDAEGGKAEVFERSGLRGRVEKWVKKEWDVGCVKSVLDPEACWVMHTTEKQSPSFVM
jgi:hypothetical protein